MKRAMRFSIAGKSPWEWEKTREIVVFIVGKGLNTKKSSVIKDAYQLVKEWQLPLHVTDGNLSRKEDEAIIRDLIRQSLKGNRIDYDEVERGLGIIRDSNHVPYGLVIIIDKQEYEFREPTSPDEQPAIYGIGVDDGLVILRHTHRESIRHELAHMLGLTLHHNPYKPGCNMNWECDTPSFCEECKKEIAQIWQEDIHPAK